MYYSASPLLVRSYASSWRKGLSAEIYYYGFIIIYVSGGEGGEEEGYLYMDEDGYYYDEQAYKNYRILSHASFYIVHTLNIAP